MQDSLKIFTRDRRKDVIQFYDLIFLRYWYYITYDIKKELNATVGDLY